MLALEGEFFKATKQHGGRDGYLGYMAPYCRIQRSGRFPMTGKEAAAKYFDEIKLAVIAWEGLDGGIAKSGELGYTYGRYEIRKTENGTEQAEKGYFTHVWKRDAKGAWKLVADVTSALPAGE